MKDRSWTRQEERALRAALDRGGDPACPRCGTALESRPVPPSHAVSYVRRRIWYVCGGCGGSLVVDRPRGSAP